MDEYGNNNEERELTPEEQAAKAIEDAKHRASIAAASEQWEKEMQRRAAEQKAAEIYRRVQEEQAARIEAENKAREEAARRQKAEKKARRKKGLKITAIVLAVALLVGAAGNAAGSIASTIGELKAQLESMEKRAQSESSGEKPTKRPETEEGETKRESSPSVATGTALEAAVGSLTDVSDIVEEALPSVVSILVTQLVTSSGYWGGSRQYETEGAGSGILIGQNEEELWIVTNYHVVEDATAVSVQFSDESSADAFVKGTSKTNDLAVLGVKLADMSLETLGAVRVITIGESDSLRLGQGVVAIGNALGWGQSVTTGVISALNREVSFNDGTSMYLLQTSAAINPGNSGGALLNASGELVGINNAKYSDTDVEGVGFAIPISSVKDIMEELSLMEPREKVSEEDFPYIGVTFKDLSSSYMQAYGMPTGAYIYEVGPDTPAARAGLLSYDIITRFGDAEITGYDSLMNEMQYYSGGTEVSITVMRLERGRYVEKTLTLVLGYKKDYN